jgi:hypothetical protein
MQQDDVPDMQNLHLLRLPRRNQKGKKNVLYYERKDEFDAKHLW